MTNNEAIEVMCRRCSNHEVCNGTGCEPRNVLTKLIADYNDCRNELCEMCGEYQWEHIPDSECRKCRWAK